MTWRVEERVDLCNGHPLLRLSHLHDFVARTHLSFLENAQVKPGPSTGRQQCWHPGLVHPDSNAIAGHAGLCDLEQRAADLITVANAHRLVRQSLDREILAELSVDELSPVEPFLPIAIRFDLVDEDGTLLTPVPSEIALTVSVEIQPADPTSATHRSLPDCGVHRATLPLDIAWESDVHRQQLSHVAQCARGRAALLDVKRFTGAPTPPRSVLIGVWRAEPRRW